MVLPNLLFDLLLFGLLIGAAALDSFVPATHGVSSLLIVGGTLYWAAQELSEGLLRRTGWSQESLATSISVCAGGFLYWWFRNQSDLALLVLSIGLMMAALMVAISIIAAFSTTFKEGRPTALLGWLAALVGGLVLGILVGVLALVLGAAPGRFEATTLFALKAGALVVAFIGWKVRENFNPPAANPYYQNLLAQDIGTGASKKSVVAAPVSALHARYALMPQRGTLLDRLMPLLIVGVVLLFATSGRIAVPAPFSPAVAAPSAK